MKALSTFAFFLSSFINVFAQSSIENIDKRYHYFSYQSNDKFWVSSEQGWHSYDGKEVKTYGFSDKSSGLKGTFVQSELFPDKDGKLWTTTYEYICYFDQAEDRFHCMQPIFEGDTINASKGLYFFETDNAFLFAKDQKLLLLNTEDYSIKHYTEEPTKDVAISFFDEVENELYTSPWVSKPLFEKWTLKRSEVEHEEFDFANCNSVLNSITVSDFSKQNKHFWLASSIGLVKWNENESCNSGLFLYKNRRQTVINIREYLDHFLVTTDKNGVLIFDIEQEKYIGKLHSTHQNIPLNSNFVLDVFEKGSSFVFSFHDAALQEIDKALVNKEILLGESPLTNAKFLKIESNEDYLAISDRNNYIHIFDSSWEKVHTIDISEMLVLMDLGFIENQFVFSTINELQVIDLLDKTAIVSIPSDKNINSLSTDGEDLYLIGAGYAKQISGNKIKEKSISYIPKLIHFLKQDQLTLSTSTTTLRVEKEAYKKDYEFEAFIQEIQKGRTENEFIVRSEGQLFLLDIEQEILKPLEYENIKINGILVKNGGEIIVWDDKSIYAIDSKNTIRKIIHAEKPYEVQFFGGKYVYTSGIKMYMVDEKDIIQSLTNSLTIYSANYPYQSKNGNYRFSYKYFEQPLEVTFNMNNVESNEHGYYSFISNDGEKTFVSIQDPLPITYFPEGKNRLTIQGYNQDGSLTNSIDLEIQVKGPFWRQWWFYALIGSILIGGTILYFRNREKRLKDKFILEQEISNLQKSALQAQMNPHFIFNCLNSIQSFIMKNDKENAMDYLGQFARLIRANLNASLTDKISLEEEVRILENYLSLEKLRMNDVFDYDINISQDLKSVDIFFPPMLVQPFVENAVIHGMYGKTGGGLIVVEFQKDGHNLLVNVIDNGGTRVEKKQTDHKSVGVEITQKRLAHINKSSSDQFNVSMEQTENTTTVQLKVRYTEEVEE